MPRPAGSKTQCFCTNPEAERAYPIRGRVTIMFALTVLGSMLVAASIVALVRRHSETRNDHAPTGLGLNTLPGRGHKTPAA